MNRARDHRLSQHRDDAIMVELAVPGERWEVDFGTIADASALLPMRDKHVDPDAEAAHPKPLPPARSGRA